MEWNNELLEDLQLAEDAIEAYENGFYDTHNLENIEDNIEEYYSLYEGYKGELPAGYSFASCQIINKKLEPINPPIK